MQAILVVKLPSIIRTGSKWLGTSSCASASQMCDIYGTPKFTATDSSGRIYTHLESLSSVVHGLAVPVLALRPRIDIIVQRFSIQLILVEVRLYTGWFSLRRSLA